MNRRKADLPTLLDVQPKDVFETDKHIHSRFIVDTGARSLKNEY